MEITGQYRGRLSKYHQWVYGYYFNNCEIGVNLDIIINHDELNGIGKEHIITRQYLCKSTGIKDKNGNEIFEFDILKGHHKDNFLIENINGGLQMYNIGFYGQFNNELISDAVCSAQAKSWLQDAEVIGNVFDNEELLHTGALAGN
jgi:uncharacterized phage protein (TIGR01671 family)